MGIAERERLAEDTARVKFWKQWGPYLSERQWGTVREDYSSDGDVWRYFPHDHARSRAYRWGEDGLLGICDYDYQLCFALALWNGHDPILKERLFGLDSHEGNHGEDVKEAYFYLDNTPTHSYMRALYKYPQAEFPYARLVAENARRTRQDPEFELADTGIFDGGRYFDVQVEYAKASPDDVLIRLEMWNRGEDDADLVVLPTIWFRNYWSWSRSDLARPTLAAADPWTISAQHPVLGGYNLRAAQAGEVPPGMLFTENESDAQRLWGTANSGPFVKDAFHRYVIDSDTSAVNPARRGTKAAFVDRRLIPPGGSVRFDLRLTADAVAPTNWFGAGFDEVFEARRADADEFYAEVIPRKSSPEQYAIARQAYAGLLWSKQAYNYVVRDWLEGDPGTPPPPEHRRIRNDDWPHLYSRDILSMPDSWEYPWFAAWDLAFQMIPFARLDPDFAKSQLILLLREWYMNPSGQIPAYEFNFDEVNPPVHAWAAWRVYKLTGPKGARDLLFLERVFHKLLVNFVWWVNRKDQEGNNLFSGGFLGLDNVGVFDRNKPLPGGQCLEQADGTAWMAFYAQSMLSMSLELAVNDPAYEDMASKFFEHYVQIAEAMNALGGTGLWDEETGFYYDQLALNGSRTPLRIRSGVGLVPLFACECIDNETIDRLPGFKKRMEWFLANRADLHEQISYMREDEGLNHNMRLLAIPSRERLVRALSRVLDENEFLSPFGVRSLSRYHRDHPFTLIEDGAEYAVRYTPGESDTGLFGGNSNWRGPVWFPLNYLLIESLERYHHYYGDSLQLEFPSGSGRYLNLGQISQELAQRLTSLFTADAAGRRAVNGDEARFARDPHWRDLVLFHEYFHGDTGCGLGASHQTGWTALVTRCLEKVVTPHSVSRPTETLKAITEQSG